VKYQKIPGVVLVTKEMKERENLLKEFYKSKQDQKNPNESE